MPSSTISILSQSRGYSGSREDVVPCLYVYVNPATLLAPGYASPLLRVKSEVHPLYENMVMILRSYACMMFCHGAVDVDTSLTILGKLVPVLRRLLLK